MKAVLTNHFGINSIMHLPGGVGISTMCRATCRGATMEWGPAPGRQSADLWPTPGQGLKRRGHMLPNLWGRGVVGKRGARLKDGGRASNPFPPPLLPSPPVLSFSSRPSLALLLSIYLFGVNAG